MVESGRGQGLGGAAQGAGSQVRLSAGLGERPPEGFQGAGCPAVGKGALAGGEGAIDGLLGEPLHPGQHWTNSAVR